MRERERAKKLYKYMKKFMKMYDDIINIKLYIYYGTVTIYI